MAEELDPFLEMLVVDLVRRDGFEIGLAGLLLFGHEPPVGRDAQPQIQLAAARVMFQVSRRRKTHGDANSGQAS